MYPVSIPRSWGQINNSVMATAKISPDFTYTIQEIKDLEKNIVESYDFCRLSSTDRSILEKEAGIHKFQLNKESFPRLLALARRNVDLRQKIACLIQSTFALSDKLSTMNSFFDIFQSAIAGKNTVNYALANKEKTMVIKTSGNAEAINHEALIGMVVINEILKECPYFIYTYGLINCFSYSRGKNIECDTRIKTGKSLLLDVATGITLDDYVKSTSTLEYLEILLQIESALNYAYEKYEFTHYDLHPGNIIIEKFDYPINVPLFFESKKQLMTKNFVRIIDYGMSFAKIEKIPFGFTTENLENLSIYHDKPYPMYDTYKLLCFSAIRTSGKNNKLIDDVLRPCFSFFGNLDERILTYENNVKRKLADYCQCDERYIERTHLDFINFIFETQDLLRELDISPFDTEEDGADLSWDDLLRNFYDYHRPPKSSKEYLEALNIIKLLPEEEQMKNWLQEHTNMREIVDNESGQIIKEIKNRVNLIRNYDSLKYYTDTLNYIRYLEDWLKITPYDNDKVMEIEDLYNELIDVTNDWVQRNEK